MAIIYHEIDLDDINEAIERYEPTVAMVEEGFQNEGYSILLMDLNCGICPLWMDFYMSGGMLQIDWNGVIFNLKSQIDVERYLLRFDERVRLRAEEVAFKYMIENGIMRGTKDGRCELVQGFGNRKIRSIDQNKNVKSNGNGPRTNKPSKTSTTSSKPKKPVNRTSTAKRKTSCKPRGVNR